MVFQMIRVATAKLCENRYTCRHDGQQIRVRWKQSRPTLRNGTQCFSNKYML